MKLTLLLFILTIVSCTNSVNPIKRLISSEFTQGELSVVYSEFIVANNEFIGDTNGSEHIGNIKIKIVRTNSINNKQIRQSSHDLKANLKVGMKYHVSTSINKDKLNVWIVNSETLDVVSTVSTINTVFEKVFTLKEMTKDKVKRIKIILNNKQDEIAHLRVINKKKPRYTWD